MFEITETLIPGCIQMRPRIFEDARGRFIKTFHRGSFKSLGLNTRWAEEYYSVSSLNVLRGLHFQLPPHEHDKLIHCLSGEVLDAVVDLRHGSPTFGRHVLVHLRGDDAGMIYIPRGLAHGFLALSDKAVIVYKVSAVHAPAHDTGIRWDSASIPWPAENPIVSARDASLPVFSGFETPFSFRRQENA